MDSSELASWFSTVRVDAELDEIRPRLGRLVRGALRREGKVCIRLQGVLGIRERTSDRRMAAEGRRQEESELASKLVVVGGQSVSDSSASSKLSDVLTMNSKGYERASEGPSL